MLGKPMREAGKVVEVAAAVMLRVGATGEPEFLLACRPDGKVYAGYWEFPGGKVEPGESVRDALVRELHEELGIQVTAASPWLHKQFEYPHATVHLNFWRVTAWDGEIGITAPLEHSAVSWVPVRDALAAEQHLSPILPANGPILKGLALPEQMLITQAEEIGLAAEHARLTKWIAQHPQARALVQIRDRGLPAGMRRAWAEIVLQLTRPAGLIAVLNCADAEDLALAQALGVDGVHLTSAALKGVISRPDFTWVGASCHHANELRQVEALGLDYALLGPVKATQTHPDAVPLGWSTFAALIADNRVPVFALGGMLSDDLPTAQAGGAHGIACLRGW